MELAPLSVSALMAGRAVCVTWVSKTKFKHGGPNRGGPSKSFNMCTYADDTTFTI